MVALAEAFTPNPSADIAALIERITVTDTTAAAVDFETYYDNQCSVKPLGNYAYCRHADFNAYLVTIYAPSVGVYFVGHPKDAPWPKICGLTWLSHNRNFDRTVFEYLVETGVIVIEAGQFWREWHDTADLACYVHLPRALAKAVKFAFGLVVSKALRDTFMKGKLPGELTPDQWCEWCTYAMNDALLCWALWQTFNLFWPEHERALSVHTGNIEFRGVPVDWEQAGKLLQTCNAALHVVEQRIPWTKELDKNGDPIYKLYSRKGIALECIRAGVPPPASTDAKSREFLEWLDEYGERVPSLVHLGRHRRIKNVRDRLKNLFIRRRPDDRAAVGLKYFGAAKTGRWSGTAGFSLHNLRKNPLYFDSGYSWLPTKAGAAHIVDLRPVLTAPPGRQLCIADLSQIEPRVLNWFLGNKEFLDLCRKGMSPYEAHARVFMGWTGGKLKAESPLLYALAKARVLALGYGAGWFKFIAMASSYITDADGNLDVAMFDAIFAQPTKEEQREAFIEFLEFCEKKTEAIAFRELDDRTKNVWVNAWLQVRSFREANANLCSRKDPLGLWAHLQRDFQASMSEGIYEVGLPSGRSLFYFNISSRGGWRASQGSPGEPPTGVYGGLLVENLTQACARDVFALGILRLEAAGYQVLFHVHDEYVILMPAHGTVAEVLRIIREVPSWAESLPVDAEAKLSPCYQK